MTRSRAGDSTGIRSRYWPSWASPNNPDSTLLPRGFELAENDPTGAKASFGELTPCEFPESTYFPRRRSYMWVMAVSGTRIVEHSVLTPLPVRSALPGCRHLAQRGNVTQTVLYFRYCIEAQNRPRFSEDAHC